MILFKQTTSGKLALQRRIYMAACISNNFVFIFFIVVKNYHKVERPETEVEGSIKRFI